MCDGKPEPKIIVLSEDKSLFTTKISHILSNNSGHFSVRRNLALWTLVICALDDVICQDDMQIEQC